MPHSIRRGRVTKVCGGRFMRFAQRACFVLLFSAGCNPGSALCPAGVPGQPR